MNAMLENIALNASDDLKKLITEGADDILTAIHKMESESQLQETKPKFSLGFKITVDFDKATYDCDLSWSLKQSLSVSHAIDDPNQEKLPLEKDNSDDLKIEISSPGREPVKTTLGGLKKLNRKLAGKLAKNKGRDE